MKLQRLNVMMRLSLKKASLMRHDLVAVVVSLALCASAQDRPKDLEPLPEPPPSVDGGAGADEPQVTIIQRADEKVEEYRVRGRLYMIKITPKHGVPYYLVDRAGKGQFVRLESLDEGFSVPTWVILEF